MVSTIRKAGRIVMLALLAPLVAAQPAAENHPEPAQRYSLKPESRVFGIGGGGGGNAVAAVPFNRSYEELSGEQQAQVKRSYEAMDDGDKPPFPVGGLRTLYDPITKVFQRLLISATFVAEVQIGRDGVPVSMVVFKSPDPEITRVVSGIILLSKFKPGRCQQVSCAMAFPVRITFEVE